MNRNTLILVAIAALLAGYVYLEYRADIDAARERVAQGGSVVVQTPCGPIEYAVAGSGAPVLIVHGAGGGFDQGMMFGRALAERGFRVIAMSRFGYLRTPLSRDASVEAQADAHACLLAALGIEQAGVIGVSAGAPSAMQLALRHPGRTKALVLLAPATYAPRSGDEPSVTVPAFTELLFDTALRSDFAFWAALRLARDTMIRAILATPPELVANAAAEEQARAQRILESILPVTSRRPGLLNDAAFTSSIPRYELERIAAPTLAISSRDDLFGTFESASYAAGHIPNARFIGYERGGHIWIGHDDEVMQAIARFLK